MNAQPASTPPASRREKIVTCPLCGLTQHLPPLPERASAECARCGTGLATQHHNHLARTAAFSLAALLLYVPANIYPILRMDFRGVYSDSTIWDGVVQLFAKHQWLIAIIVFLASILIPLLKLLGLFYLVISTKFKSSSSRVARSYIYKIISLVGPWAMLDVFLLAVLVALVKLGSIATVTPGPGLLAFAAVVVFTILASSSFNPHQIWESSENPA